MVDLASDSIHAIGLDAGKDRMMQPNLASIHSNGLQSPGLRQRRAAETKRQPLAAGPS